MIVESKHYIGFYLKCSKPKQKKVDNYQITAICRMSPIKVKNKQFYIPSTQRALCYDLDKYSNFGTLQVGKIELYPEWMEIAFDTLERFYEHVVPEYGIITYATRSDYGF
jgi:hypothetical protein